MLAEKSANEQAKIEKRVTELLGRLHKAIDDEVTRRDTHYVDGSPSSEQNDVKNC